MDTRDSFVAVRNVLQNFASVSDEDVQGAFSTLEERLCRSGHENDKFVDAHGEATLSLLVQVVAAKLDEETSVNGVRRAFDGLFLECTRPWMAFKALIEALLSDEGDAAERDDDRRSKTLAAFSLLERFLGGEERVKQLLQSVKSADDGIRGQLCQVLVSLPGRVANGLQAAPSRESPLNEVRYMRTLARAVCTTWHCAPNSVESSILSRLLAASSTSQLETWFQAAVKHVAAHHSEDSLVEMLLSAPSSFTEKVLRAVLSCHRAPIIAKVLYKYLMKSPAAAQLSATAIYMRRPIMDRERTEILVRAQADASVKPESPSSVMFLKSVLLTWSGVMDLGSERTYDDLPLERQRTRALLLWLRLCDRDVLKSSGDLSLQLARGIQERLRSSEFAVRLMAMFVGELFTSLVDSKEPLKFDRPSGWRPDADETDLERLADLHRALDSEQGLAGVTLFTEPTTGADEARKNSAEGRTPNEIQRPESGSDTDSLEAYDMSDDVNSGENLRKEIHSTSSALRLLNFIRASNRGDDDASNKPQLLSEALDSLLSTVRARVPGAVYYAKELTRTVLAVQPAKYPPDDASLLQEKRAACLDELVAADVKNVGLELVQNVVYRSGAVLSTRSEALRLLATGARRTCGRFEQAVQGGHVEAQSARRANGPPSKPAGRVIRRSERSLRAKEVETKLVRNLFAPAAWALYRALAWPLASLCSRQDGETFGLGALDIRSLPLQLDERDTSLLGQIIATLSVFVSCAGPQCLQRDDMAEDVVKVALSRWNSPGEARCTR
mmetsp:Transcript_4230/g.12737  ORF Transcript_4230/g.12737 Transcript_4230/m.12737 type:complete len:784 (+) Transcript_4230:191-2542(+)